MRPARAGAVLVNPHALAVLVGPDVVAMDVSVAGQVFGHPGEQGGYRFTVCAEEPGPVTTSAGFVLDVVASLDALASADTVVVPGSHPWHPPSPAVRAALVDAYRRGARIVSTCVGAFTLAAAGLLDGRRATTHWQETDALQRRHPTVRVVSDVLYVESGRVLTGAGQSAGIDLFLHLVEQDFGAAARSSVARRMLVPAARLGEQKQLPPPVRESDPVSATAEWAAQRLAEPLTLERLADHAHMSTRTFTRQFRSMTTVSPMTWLAEQRLLHARSLLEATSLSVDDVARESGFGSARNLRQQLARATGLSPRAYRSARRATASRAG